MARPAPPRAVSTPAAQPTGSPRGNRGIRARPDARKPPDGSWRARATPARFARGRCVSEHSTHQPQGPGERHRAGRWPQVDARPSEGGRAAVRARATGRDRLPPQWGHQLQPPPWDFRAGPAPATGQKGRGAGSRGNSGAARRQLQRGQSWWTDFAVGAGPGQEIGVVEAKPPAVGAFSSAGRVEHQLSGPQGQHPVESPARSGGCKAEHRARWTR